MNSGKYKSLSIPQQIKYIQDSYQISIDDPKYVDVCLNNIGFYRLISYFTKLRNASFSNIIEHYEFDRKLRLIIIDAIERIEVAIKTTLITVLGEIYNHDPFWHTIEGCFNNNKHHANFTKFVDEIKLRYYSDIEIRKAASLNQSIPAWKVIEKLLLLSGLVT